MKSPLSVLARSAGFVALALVSGCESAPVRHPKTTQIVVLSPENASPTVGMGLVSAIQVVLPGPDAGSGYAWEIGSNNNKVLEQMSPLRMTPATGAPGSRATTAASFYSLRPGKSVLRFFLVRPSEAEAVPAGSFQVTVRVKD
jgi:hypothetical protein